jgi:hypothetical protein
MLEILKNMVKEEWRIHSTMFGGRMFFLFPIVILVFSFVGSLFLPMYTKFLAFNQIALLTHYIFVLFGLSIGAFGLFGREIMNRRFGQASMIAYSSRTLPLSERKIFLNFFIKDIIYYFLLWILPFVVGFAAASPFISMSLSYSPLLLLTLTLSFLIGLSFSFVFSTIYVHSKKLLVGSLSLLVILGLAANSYSHITLVNLLPPLSFFFQPSASKLILSLAIVIVASSLSIAFLKVDYPEKKRRFKNSFDMLTGRLGFSKYSSFVTKDFLDLNRSEGGAGKIIFSFLFPLSILWLLLSVLFKVIPNADMLITFSIFLGVISSSIYNWLTEFDLFTAYSFLPVKVSTVIKSKINSYLLLNLVSLLILIFVATGTGFHTFLPAVVSFVIVSLYSLSVIMYLTGLYPNILLYNAKILLAYLFSISPVLLALLFLSIFNVSYIWASLLLILPSIYLIKKSFSKWDNWEHPSF